MHLRAQRILTALAIAVVSIGAAAVPQQNTDKADIANQGALGHDAPAGKGLSAEEAAAKARRLEWFKDAKFGMFIHWGLYSQLAGEYKGQLSSDAHIMLRLKIPLKDYAQIAKDFNPTKFDGEAWAQLAQDAGMKYMVITTKHHDGFAMFNSPSNDYNIVKQTPWGKDPLKSLSDACHKRGIKFCVYYSLGRDWADPDVPTRDGWRSNTWDYPDEAKKDFSKYFERKVKPQIRELLTQYGEIGMVWFDTPEKISVAQSKELVALIHSLQPNCIINARVGHGLGDYATPEQQIPNEVIHEPWETCMTINHMWGYVKRDTEFKAPEQLLFNLVDIASKGGNYLLNVGPTGEGVIPQPEQDRLHYMGAWLQENGEAIYGAGPTPFGAELGKPDPEKKDRSGKPAIAVAKEWRATTKPGKLYITVFQWPKDGELVIPALSNEVKGAHRLLDAGKAVALDNAADGIHLHLGAASEAHGYPTVIAIDVEGTPTAK
ncbi:MAG: alpha-L-fucosidase [Phycisphaerae bacterium]